MSRKDAILAAEDLRREPVEVPEWPDAGRLFVREMSGEERLAFEMAIKDDGSNTLPMIVACTLCDESGDLIFGPEDVPAIAGKNAKVIRRIYDSAVALNRVEKGAVEAAEKN